MSTPNLQSNAFKIVSFTHRTAASVEEVPLPIQTVRLGLPVEKWHAKVVDDNHRFSLNGYLYTGVEDGKVIVSVDPKDGREWKIKLALDPAIYTIVLAEDPTMGWTVSPDKSANPEIVIDTITSPPCQEQMFMFRPIDE